MFSLVKLEGVLSKVYLQFSLEASDLQALVVADTETRAEGHHAGEGEGAEGDDGDESLHDVVTD